MNPRPHQGNPYRCRGGVMGSVGSTVHGEQWNPRLGFPTSVKCYPCIGRTFASATIACATGSVRLACHD